jgi:hypothetical protein
VDDQPERDEITVAVVGPDPRLLLVLVVLLVGAAITAIFLLDGDDDAGRVPLGTLTGLAEQAEAGPVRLAELPHLVVVRTATRAPVYDASWGENTGSVLLSPDEQLVVLETRDPQDGAQLRWCRAAQAFAHPDGTRWYAADGTLLAGTGRRGMDRRAVTVIGAAVVVDDASWVQGQPLQKTRTSWSPRGDCTA